MLKKTQNVNVGMDALVRARFARRGGVIRSGRAKRGKSGGQKLPVLTRHRGLVIKPFFPANTLLALAGHESTGKNL